ncbi:nickel-dependent hydrogenase large subunit [Denitromonas iodatirespirans]|uniref:Nickel-dependent hydrogenase large subunit n=1 Tax=Denitromonas iodatirespirans TaxID=2795389 RepID=A0A944D4N0_DENI1|nr:nickel-dependent hydrogenase large subunit [Denitromonas iodatirespirans]MBT0959765.1 nickel-dependent hydrogenase large subunit [Denitromonas iodatirespirans]
MSRQVLGPFNRVEGDLEVTLEAADGRVSAAWVNSPLYRGFEQILPGKAPMDALVLVPRICGICSVSQSAAAAAALADLAGVRAPPNGARATNLMLAAENLADHFTHFYLFFMPDFARDAYAGTPGFDAVRTRFKAVEGSAAAEALPARARFLQLMGMLAGKWPHTLSLQPGGSARAILPAERVRLLSLLREFRGWLERHLFGDALEAVTALDSVDALWAWFEAGGPARGDLARFLDLSRRLGLETLGRCPERYLSFGNYPVDGARRFAPGVWDAAVGNVHPLDARDIVEDLSHAWLAGSAVAHHPLVGETHPDADKPDAYSWCKAPRWCDKVVQCGALARQVVDGHPLARSLVAQGGGNVMSRVVGRLLEIARVVPMMEAWVRELVPGEPFCVEARLPDSGVGVGRVEAARGALGHWLVVRGGRIQNYQIIAPTTWNFSPRDAAGTPGALEQALVGLPVSEGADMPLAVQHVVRSFDPCMVCTVH